MQLSTANAIRTITETPHAFHLELSRDHSRHFCPFTDDRRTGEVFSLTPSERAMAARGHGNGRVVLIGSRVAQRMPGRGQYAATRTSMLQDPARAGSAPRLPPIGRLVQPGEIAALVGFLLSPAAAAITGQDIAIRGGSSLSR